MVSLLINGDYAEFNPQVVTRIRETISQVLGIAVKQVAYLLSLPYNSYYVVIQVPEQVVQSLKSEVVSRPYWLGSLNCLEVRINDLDCILLQSSAEYTMQVDGTDQRDSGHQTGRNCQHPLLCNYRGM